MKKNRKNKNEKKQKKQKTKKPAGDRHCTRENTSQKGILIIVVRK